MLIALPRIVCRAPRRFKHSPRVWSPVAMTESLPPCRKDPVVRTLDTPEFRSIFTPELRTLSALFARRNYQLRLAGGAVRDILMARRPTDLDFATDATPEQMKSMFREEGVRTINDRGEKHGTITARINEKENFEVTTLRVDVLTDGRHAQVQFTGDWRLDALRRDLTINSMYLDLEGRLYDYFYGYEDLLSRRVAFVGDPVTRIREDYLRILRYFRFHGRVSERADEFDEDTLRAIRENAGGLAGISGERIWSEWSKILAGSHAMELTLKMIDCGIAQYIGLPSDVNTDYFTEVCTNSRSAPEPLRPITLASSLLRTEDDVHALNSRLRLSAADRDLALFLLRHRAPKPEGDPLRPYTRLLVHWRARPEDGRAFVQQLLESQGLFRLAGRLRDTEIPRFPVNGHALKEHVRNRKLIGAVIGQLKDVWHDGDFRPTKEELLKEVPRILEDLESRSP